MRQRWCLVSGVWYLVVWYLVVWYLVRTRGRKEQRARQGRGNPERKSRERQYRAYGDVQPALSAGIMCNIIHYKGKCVKAKSGPGVKKVRIAKVEKGQPKGKAGFEPPAAAGRLRTRRAQGPAGRGRAETRR